jgi:histidine ammonia-lyase
MTVKLDGATLGIEDAVRVARPDAQGRFADAMLAPEARERIAATRAYIDRTWMHDDAPLMYAFNTGVGLFKDQRVLIADMAAYQRKTVYAHATGVGEPFAEDVTRAMMLLRANAFASNYSGPRVELVERLIAFLNAGLHPVIPQKGSVGASGDLAPLAHMAGAVCGFAEAEMIYRGRRLPEIGRAHV